MTPAIDNYSEHLDLPLFTARYITIVYIVNCCTPSLVPSCRNCNHVFRKLCSWVHVYMNHYTGFYYCQTTCPSTCCPPLKVQNTNKLIKRYVRCCLKKFSFWYIHHIPVTTHQPIDWRSQSQTISTSHKQSPPIQLNQVPCRSKQNSSTCTSIVKIFSRCLLFCPGAMGNWGILVA